MTITTKDTARTINVADTAKILRKRLKAEFPNVKFSVRSKSYAGGASISVNWTDGPLTADVASITNQYQGAGFDGMIDLKYQREHWLKPDGTVLVRHDPGTTGNMGVVTPTDNRDLDEVMPEGTEWVRFGADHIHHYRNITDRRRREIEAETWIYAHCDLNLASQEHNTIRDKMGNIRVKDVASRMIEHQQEGDDLRAAFRRAIGLNQPAKTYPPFIAAQGDHIR